MGNTHNGDLHQNYTAGLPSRSTVFNTPLDAPGIVDYDSAFFVQDSWTLKRLTINPGLRIEWFSAGMRRRALPAGRFVPARFFPEEHGCSSGDRTMRRAWRPSTTCSATAGRR